MLERATRSRCVSKRQEITRDWKKLRNKLYFFQYELTKKDESSGSCKICG